MGGSRDKYRLVQIRNVDRNPKSSIAIQFHVAQNAIRNERDMEVETTEPIANQVIKHSIMWFWKTSFEQCYLLDKGIVLYTGMKINDIGRSLMDLCIGDATEVAQRADCLA